MPLKESLDSVRDELLAMHKRGPLLIQYYIELNEELRKRLHEMLIRDKKAQLLMGTCLR